jgi:hypothetical protein
MGRLSWVLSAVNAGFRTADPTLAQLKGLAARPGGGERKDLIRT